MPKENYQDGTFDCTDGSDEPQLAPPPPPPVCPAVPATVKNGKVKLSVGSDFGKLAVLHCDQGYKPKGDQVLYCNVNRAGGLSRCQPACLSCLPVCYPTILTAVLSCACRMGETNVQRRVVCSGADIEYVQSAANESSQPLPN